MGKVVELVGVYHDPLYVTSINKTVSPSSPITVDEETYYTNEELQELVRTGLLKIKGSSKATEASGESKEVSSIDIERDPESVLGVKIPDNFDTLHWKQQAKILSHVESIDVFRIILGVAKDGYFKDYAKKKIIDISIGK
jgi:hypothetical protein